MTDFTVEGVVTVSESTNTLLSSSSSTSSSAASTAAVGSGTIHTGLEGGSRSDQGRKSNGRESNVNLSSRLY